MGKVGNYIIMLKTRGIKEVAEWSFPLTPLNQYYYAEERRAVNF